MKAIVISEPGAPEVLQLREVDDPQVKDDEVLIKVHATALNRADTFQRLGNHHPPPGSSPYLGLECSGTIESVGKGVSRWKIGDQDSETEHLKYKCITGEMFLSHYIGDVHQPLHVGFLGDEGGNTITVRWYRRETNLHHVWDNMIIESALKTYYNKSLPLMIEALQANLTHGWSNDVPSWELCQLNQTACPNPYASESIKLACKYAYKNATPGTTLGGILSHH